jgi:hypothetical protein
MSDDGCRIVAERFLERNPKFGKKPLDKFLDQISLDQVFSSAPDKFTWPPQRGHSQQTRDRISRSLRRRLDERKRAGLTGQSEWWRWLAAYLARVNGQTLRETGELLGVSREQARALGNKALRRRKEVRSPLRGTRECQDTATRMWLTLEAFKK